MASGRIAIALLVSFKLRGIQADKPLYLRASVLRVIHAVEQLAAAGHARVIDGRDPGDWFLKALHLERLVLRPADASAMWKKPIQ
jgi:hypothetical protein